MHVSATLMEGGEGEGCREEGGEVKGCRGEVEGCREEGGEGEGCREEEGEGEGHMEEGGEGEGCREEGGEGEGCRGEVEGDGSTGLVRAPGRCKRGRGIPPAIAKWLLPPARLMGISARSVTLVPAVRGHPAGKPAPGGLAVSRAPGEGHGIKGHILDGILALHIILDNCCLEAISFFSFHFHIFCSSFYSKCHDLHSAVFYSDEYTSHKYTQY